MTFFEYQNEAKKTAVYPKIGNNYTYPVLGLVGESGEVAEKIKKTIRDDNGIITNKKKEEIKKELGDVLWYLSQLCNELGIDLADVAETNLKKLKSRQMRGKLSGSGDNR